MDNEISTGNETTEDEVDLNSLSQYVAEQTVRLEKFKDKVHFKLDLLNSEKGELTDKTIEIPEPFKKSLFCQAIIAYFYSDAFNSLSSTTKNGYLDLLIRFFLYLETRDKKLDSDERWENLLKLPNGDLPHNVLHQFLSHLSVNTRSGANSLFGFRLKLLKVVGWASEIQDTSSELNFEYGNQLLPYVSAQNNPLTKKDDVTPSIGLSQIFTINYETGEEIKCPFSDSQLITNLRWFAMWYLNVMRERRLFFRKIMWDKDRTIYQLLKEKIKDNVWSLDKAPISSMYGQTKKINGKLIPIADFVEASAIYAKIYEALLPTEAETKEISQGTISAVLENRLMWLEQLGFSTNDFPIILKNADKLISTPKMIIDRISTFIRYNSLYYPHRLNNGAVIADISLMPHKNKSIRAVRSQMLTLADMVVPSSSERLVMCWLLGSDSMQWSNQVRLALDNFQELNEGKTLQVVNDDNRDDIVVNTIKISHHKGRSTDKAKRKKGRDFETIKYKKHDPLFTTYTNWHRDVQEAQPYIVNGKGMWCFGSKIGGRPKNVLVELSPLIAQQSLLQKAFGLSEKLNKYHSEVEGQGSFKWLLSKLIKHEVYFSESKDAGKRITLNIDAIRQSRIIFTEGEAISFKENAKRTAHSEQQVYAYRENGVANERIQNGIKANVQIANKMTEEAESILNTYHLLSLKEIEKQFHAPKGITTDDVIGFINECAENPEKYEVTIFGGIMDKSNPEGDIIIIKDVKSAWMMLSYINHMESELEQIKENHDEKKVVEHIVKHTQWSMLFKRFPTEMQEQAKELAKTHDIPYPPLF